MRFLVVAAGTLFGMVAGLAIPFLAAVVLTRNDLFGVMFIGLWLSPVGLIFGGTIGAIIGLRLSPHLRERETKRIRWKRILFSLAVASSAVIILIGVLSWIVRIGMTPPSDQKLLANFEDHEAAFNELIEMLKADQDLIRVDEDWTNPENPEIIGISAGRIGTYRRLLREPRVPRGFRSEGFMYEVDFFYWMIGAAITSDTSKGYAYRTGPPIYLLNSLDGYQPPDRDETVRVYRHICGNWYLFYEYIPG
jgi:hypothetical protein